MKKLCLCLLCVLLLAGCSRGPRIEKIDALSPTRTPKPVEETPTPAPTLAIPVQRVDEGGTTLRTRYNPETDFSRQETEPGTFSNYLQNLPLLEIGAQVIAHDETVREADDYEAVLDMPVLNQNEQGAGAIVHLRAQYFYEKQEYDKIAFRLNDDFSFTFDKWRQGNKLTFVDNRAAWTTGGTEGEDEENFHDYLKTYFAYSGSKSLRTDLSEVDASDPIRIGDVFYTEGDAPRIIIVVDCATDASGNRHVMLMEGGKPAQPLRLLKNELDSKLSPWFVVDMANVTVTIDSGGTVLRTAPAEDGTPSRYKFMTTEASEP